MHWADDAYCVPYDEPELPDELFDWENYWEDYLLEDDADNEEDISILCKVCFINADTIID